MTHTISLTAPPPLVAGLAGFRDRYRALVCDVWGVLHNGVTAYPSASDALVRWRRSGGRVVLVTNSPRRPDGVAAQLAGFGVPAEAYDAIVTSGDTTFRALEAAGHRRILHIGPPRDLALFENGPFELVGGDEAEVVVVTGLTDEDNESPEDYRATFARLIERGLTLYSANPDIVVERGHQMIWCAGALARLYEDMGGAVVQVGKPFAPIYAAAFAALSAAGGPEGPDGVLAVGDGLPTDVRGAVDHDLDTLFVTGGIHAADFGPVDAPDPALVGRRLAVEGLTAVAAIPRLAW